MIVAAVAYGKTEELRALLASMNNQPGMADPDNDLVPFAQFDRLHVARFVILEPNSAEDGEVGTSNSSEWPPTLAFLGDCDGSAETFIAELAVRADSGLRRIFSYCENFISADESLVAWMHDHNIKPNANYVNWIGRTIAQIREEEALHRALSAELKNIVADSGRENPRALRQKLLSFVELEQSQHRLPLSPPAPTPIDWLVKNLLHKFGVPLLLLVLTPVFLLIAPYFALRLRMLERTDPENVARPNREHIQHLANLEDHYITNQFSAFGEIKPQAFRRYAVLFFLWLLDYSARHIYNHGYLTRVQTIHFARWVTLDNNKRVLFASNYDGSLESYMDDFINKVAWGLNLVFSNGAGYPSTRWLIKEGAEQEQNSKTF